MINTENALFALWLRAGSLEDATDTQKARKALDDIKRYIWSGRASQEFESRFAAMTDRQRDRLLEKLLPCWGCYDDVIRTAKTLLHISDSA